jgi:FkbM family methyltransferase
MPMPSLKSAGKRMLRMAGFEIRKRQPPGGMLRPIGQQDSVFEDFKARGFRPSLIFDVGASDGWWTSMVRPIFPGARFVLVEPRETGREPTVRAAVGAREGSAMLTDWDTASTLVPIDQPGVVQYAVPVTTLDRLAERFGIPDLVKLDIEGLELDALRGAGTLLGRTELFVVEVAMYRFVERPVFHEVVAYMAERGYFVYDVASFIRRPYDGAVGLMDLCFARTLRGAETAWHARR